MNKLNKKRKLVFDESNSSRKSSDNKINIFKTTDTQNKTNTFKTLSIAIPSSIIDNAQSKELRSYLVGQIARTCAIFRVDEIVIYHDSLHKDTVKDKLNFCLTNLQYLETPQYLRKTLFPYTDDLALAGLMNPLDISHHLRSNEYCKYREGVVLNRPVKENTKGSWIDIGLKKYCLIENELPYKTRVTIKLNDDGVKIHEKSELNKNNNYLNKYYTGSVVSSLLPKIKDNLYWGYIVRMAKNFKDVFDESIFNKDKYDLIIGTSDKGIDYFEFENKSKSINNNNKIDNKKNIDFSKFDNYKHCLIVFGGIQGLEGIVENDEKSLIKTKDVSELFDVYLNTCPKQGSRTIRTEEAIMITLSVLQSKLKRYN